MSDVSITTVTIRDLSYIDLKYYWPIHTIETSSYLDTAYQTKDYSRMPAGPSNEGVHRGTDPFSELVLHVKVLHVLSNSHEDDDTFWAYIHECKSDTHAK